ncbi:MAG: ATP synthase subunit I [Deltaproteobacteria bacterium]|nr:ATP synthase subunit I [Deltaproteobacteria bacterium]MBW2067366.1 ATP synthase subunit I [Deltaproteobacteria bacterium]
MIGEKEVVRRIKLVHGLLGSLAVLIASSYSYQVALSIFVGWVLMAVNFELLEWQLNRIFNRAQKPRKKVVVLLKYYARFLVLIVIVGIIVANKWVNPLAFAGGLLLIGLSFIGVAGQLCIKQALKREG